MSDFSSYNSMKCPKCKQRFSWDDSRTCPNGCFDYEYENEFWSCDKCGITVDPEDISADWILEACVNTGLCEDCYIDSEEKELNRCNGKNPSDDLEDQLYDEWRDNNK